MEFKSGFVAIIGRPNAGKSTLLNQLLKSKVAITTPKAQTTRNNIKGILTNDDYQIVFIDTPGIHKPTTQLDKEMVKEAYSSIEGVDVVYYIIDITKPFGTGDEMILQQLTKRELPIFLIVNKIDLLNKAQLLKKLQTWQMKANFVEIIPISALKNLNTEELLNTTYNYLSDNIKYYPDEQIMDFPRNILIADIIREKILYLTQQEVPHSVAIIIEEFKETDARITISALTLVDRDSQKAIIIGKNGQMIRDITNRAKSELENRYQKKVYLDLFVRVEKDWRNKTAKLQQLGYIANQYLDE